MIEVKKALKKKNYASAMIHLLAFPIEWLIGKVGILRVKHKMLFTLLFGVILILGGAFLAQIHQDYMPHFVWDGLSYSIHGIGLAPVAKIIFDFIDVTLREPR